MTDPSALLRPNRRALLVTGGALFAWSHIPAFARSAGGRDPRLVVIVLRGALDGLAAAPPLGDPQYAGLHGALALARDGADAALPLDAFFGLHPAMPAFARMYREKRALLVHAVATPYRGRSHFDGQDVLESGLAGPGRVESGWLNRAIAQLPPGQRVAPARPSPLGLGVGVTTPLILSGGAPVTGWSPAGRQEPHEDLAQRLADLYAQTDKALEASLRQGLALDKVARRETGAMARDGADAAMRLPARGAARLIAADDGPRVAAMSFGGWDTHANEGGARGRLGQLLGGLDGAFEEFERGLGDAWKDTVIVAVTEFGRTARINGTAGTDHGCGTVCFLAGGALKGGRVLADWPGLNDAQLFERRDLAPTTDLRAVLKGVLEGHLGLSRAALSRIVFPGSDSVRPTPDLIA
ncbi:MAG: hypothetical protein JWN93_2300 [Hyphomicrobiales bacterium]|nr:hypothetical protein [Hyphomicrobiales bacterium]